MYPTQRNIIKAFITQKERAAYLAGIRQVVEKAKDKMYFRTRNNHETAKECAERHNRILDDILHQELSQVEKEKGSRLPVKTN